MKGVGKTIVFPWGKDWENRGFPRAYGADKSLFLLYDEHSGQVVK